MFEHVVALLGGLHHEHEAFFDFVLPVELTECWWAQREFVVGVWGVVAIFEVGFGHEMR